MDALQHGGAGQMQPMDEENFNLVLAEEDPNTSNEQVVMEVLGPAPKSIQEADEKWTNTLRNLTSEICFVKESLVTMEREGVRPRIDTFAPQEQGQTGDGRSSGANLQPATGYNGPNSASSDNKLTRIAASMDQFVTILADMRIQNGKVQEIEKVHRAVLTSEAHSQAKFAEMESRLEDLEKSVAALKAGAGNPGKRTTTAPAPSVTELSSLLSNQREYGKRISNLEKLYEDHRHTSEQHIKELESKLANRSGNVLDQAASESQEEPSSSAPRPAASAPRPATSAPRPATSAPRPTSLTAKPSTSQANALKAPRAQARTQPLSVISGQESPQKKRKNDATPAATQGAKKPKKKGK